MNTIRVALLIPVLCLACSSGSGGTDVSPDPGVSTDSGPDLTLPDPGIPDPAAADTSDASSGCPGAAPFCAEMCGSDYLPGRAECVGNHWVCPKPWVLIEDCPPGTCWGGPTPGEVCGPNGWECHPELHPTAYEQCPDLMCPECTGFSGPVTQDGCTCECDGTYVRCKKVVIPDAPDVPGPGPDVPDVPEPGSDAAEPLPDVPVPDVPPAETTAPVTLVLDPATLQFFGLPIDSIRFAVSGHDPVAHACATLVWDYSNNGETYGPHCDDFHAGFPYALVFPDTDGPCGQWEYGSLLATEEATGCVDFMALGQTDLDLVDARVTVSGPGFNGTILANNRTGTGIVSLGLRYATDVPEDMYVQSGNEFGLPEWVGVRRAGTDAELVLFDRCDHPVCGQDRKPACGGFSHQVQNITNQSWTGQVFLTWDGRIRTLDPDKQCWIVTPAEPGEYVARFCFGWQTLDSGAGLEVVNPTCKDQAFTLPKDVVVYHANFGG